VAWSILTASCCCACQDDVFAASFIACDGISQLLDIVSESTGNTQSYCLAALATITNHSAGMHNLSQNPTLLRQVRRWLVGSRTQTRC